MTIPFLRKKYPAPPPLVHLTHAKAGSTWVDKILRELYGPYVAPRFYEIPQRVDLRAYRVYPALFMTREKFREHPELLGIHRFVVIRDLRDTLVSDYFSLRDTHELDPGGIIQERRRILKSTSMDEGLDYLLESVLHHHAAVHKSWLGQDVVVLRYEDLIRNDLSIFRELFIDTFGHPISEKQLERAVVASRFESVFRRPLGQEDPNSHGRKGEPGDWKNHFSKAFRKRFAEKYGDLVIAGGYEKDGSWIDAN